MDLYRWLKSQWDRVAAVLATAVGLVAMVSGWFGVSRSSLTAQQIPYVVSGALFGLFALGIGATLWLWAEMRDEWRKLDGIHRSLCELTGDQPVPSSDAGGVGASPGGVRELSVASPPEAGGPVRWCPGTGPGRQSHAMSFRIPVPAQGTAGPPAALGGPAGWLAGNALALVVIVGSWYGAAGEGSPRSSMAWLNLAVVGVAIGGTTNRFWLGRGRRVLRHARSEMTARIGLVPGGPAATPTLEPGPERVVSGPNMTRFHRPDCPLVTGKRCQPGDPATLERQHLLACEVCEP